MSEASPSAPAAPRRAVWAALAAPFRRAGRWFYYAPRALQVALVALLVAGSASSAYYAKYHLKKRAVARAVAAAWQDGEDAARKADLDGLRAALDRVLAADPCHAPAAARRAALDAGSADPDDVELAAALMNDHLRHDRLGEAAREAAKVHARAPRRWRPLCVLAHHALRVNQDAAAARRWLDALPDPDNPAARADAGAVLYALRLTEWVGGDPAPLRGRVVRGVLPFLRAGAADAAPPAGKAQLIECYLQPFADRANLNELAGYWGVVARLADSAVAGAAEAGDVASLVQLGRMGPRMIAALAQLRDHGQIPAEQVAAHAKEVNDWTRRAWQAARERNPTDAEAYRGLVLVAVAERNFPQAIETLSRGLAACGDRPELLDLLTPLAVAGRNPGAAVKLTWAAAEMAGRDPTKWCLAASAALAAGDHPRAISACANARRSVPAHPWACVTEAGLWLEEGQPSRALYLLRGLDRPVLLADPQGVRRYGRALVECETPLGEIGKEAEGLRRTAVEKRAAPAVPVALLRGVLDARDPTAGRAGWVADRARKLLADWPEDSSSRRLMADALYRQSELSEPPWAAEPARAALVAYQGLPAADLADVAVAAAVAALHLKALNDPGAALRAAARLRDPAAKLGPAQVEVLASVLTANGDAASAIRVLGPVCTPPTADRATPGGTAGCWVQLARAYHANRQPADARAALGTAASFAARSSREEAERRETEQLLRQTP
jgi:hypothetical protein